MGRAIGELLPLAVGVALSPLAVIVVVALLFSPQAKVNGSVYLVGWLIAVGLVAGVALAASDAASVGSDESATDVASWVKLALGVLLLFGAWRRWESRPGDDAEPAVPKWMAGIDAFGAPKAFALGVVFVVKPKNLILCIAAGTTIAQADLPGGQQVGSLAVFIILASVGIAIPVVYHALGGDRARRTMAGWKRWLQLNNAVVMTIVFVAFGFVLCGQAIRTLSA